MNSPIDAAHWVQRYLDLLEVEHAEPSLANLTRLTRAHLAHVPFENVTAILRRHAAGDGPVAPLDTEATLTAWQARGGGGLCFEVVPMVDQLLTGLGYRTHPVLAYITFEGSHQGNLVDLGGRRYLVDVGNGAPFLEPIPLDRATEIRAAGLAYRFRPDTGPDAWVQERWIDEAWAPFCHYALVSPDPHVRQAAYARHHARSWVVDNLVLIRSSEHDVWALRDTELRHFTAEGKTVEPIASDADYARLAADIFGLPALAIDRARAALASRRVSND